MTNSARATAGVMAIIVIYNNELKPTRPGLTLAHRDMDHQNLIAIDVHTHAEVSCWNPFDNYG